MRRMQGEEGIVRGCAVSASSQVVLKGVFTTGASRGSLRQEDSIRARGRVVVAVVVGGGGLEERARKALAAATTSS